MNVTYSNIILVCLDSEFNKLICKELASKLDMFFADLGDYLEYDLLDSKAILEKCGLEYLLQREFNASKSFSKFENAVLTTNFNLFKQNRKAFTKKSLIVYLQLAPKNIDKSETVNLLAYKSCDDYLSKNANLTVKLKSRVKNKAIKQIIAQLQEAL